MALATGRTTSKGTAGTIAASAKGTTSTVERTAVIKRIAATVTTKRAIAWSAGTWSETIIKRTAVVGRTTAESVSVITSKRTTTTNSASECAIL